MRDLCEEHGYTEFTPSRDAKAQARCARCAALGKLVPPPASPVPTKAVVGARSGVVVEIVHAARSHRWYVCCSRCDSGADPVLMTFRKTLGAAFDDARAHALSHHPGAATIVGP